MSLKVGLTIAAGAAAAGLAVYCIYFDHKRRSDPNFRQKLRQKRRQAKLNSSGAKTIEFPDVKDTEAVQRFFLSEVQTGEELLGTGDVEAGVDHLTNAVAVCGQPQQLLSVLQQTLPTSVFQMLISRLPSVSQRFARHAAQAQQSDAKEAGKPSDGRGETAGKENPASKMMEDDLE